MQNSHRNAIRCRDLALQPPQVVSEDRVIGGQGHRTLQSLGIRQLPFPAEPPDPTGDVHLDLKLAHLMLGRNQTDPRGGTVTFALAVKWPQGSSRAVTTPRFPKSPEPS